MKNMKYNCFLIMVIFIIAGCAKEIEKSDAYGHFEARMTTVSSQARGQLLFLNVSEGQELDPDELVAIIDTTQLDLERSLLESQLGSINFKKSDPAPEITIYKKQKQNLERERDRLQKLVAAKAATPKQLDDINGEIEVVRQKIQSTEDMATTANEGILADKDPIRAKIRLIEQQINNCYVYHPYRGKVINQLSEPSEVVNYGTPLYTFADLSTITLRAYADASFIQGIKINDQVAVLVDEGLNHMRKLPGVITWIASEAEFTPKTIQTREERVNLVYALKIEVENDGRLKIGMPAEVMFDPDYEPVIASEE